MSQIKTLNGVQYTLPGFNDTGWGANTGNVLTQYLAAIADVTLQLTGGAFTLTAETDFGSNFGLKALYIKSETTNPASAGVLRLAKTDSVKWRNNANGADIALSIDGSDNLTFGGTKVILSGLIVNADVANGAAIAYSKLALTGSIVNADVSASAAIAYSKLALSASIVNADIASGAAIAVNKLAALTVSRAMVTDGSGFASAASVTATELGYVSGVTSSIQTQLNATIANPLTSNLSAGSHKITSLTNGSAATDAAAFGQIPTASMGATSGDFTSSSSTLTVITGCTVTVTPRSSSSRFKLSFCGLIWSVSSATTDILVKFCRGGVAISSFYYAPAVPLSRQSCAGVYIDSPATASSVTYDVRVSVANNSSTIKFNDGTQSALTVEEYSV